MNTMENSGNQKSAKQSENTASDGLGAEKSVKKCQASTLLACDISSMVVGGEKLEGEALVKFIEGMSEEDLRTMIQDIGLLDILNKPTTPTL